MTSTDNVRGKTADNPIYLRKHSTKPGALKNTILSKRGDGMCAASSITMETRMIKMGKKNLGNTEF